MRRMNGCDDGALRLRNGLSGVGAKPRESWGLAHVLSVGLDPRSGPFRGRTTVAAV